MCGDILTFINKSLKVHCISLLDPVRQVLIKRVPLTNNNKEI